MRASRHCNRLPAARRPMLNPQGAVPSFIASAFVKPRAGLSGMGAVRQLAEDFREAAQREGGADRDHLKVKGWTSAQLDEHGPAAIVLAQRLQEATL